MPGGHERHTDGGGKKKYLIGFNLVYYGWHQEDWHPEYDGKREQIGDHAILKRSEFRNYLDSDFFAAFEIWARSARRGLPGGGGWRDEPEAVLDLLDLFDAERDRLDRKERSGNADKR